ncbi:MAG TPA: helix-turn-helix domain-containing protein [Alphaproteobacteria bacterium]|nr:helix-turn-helix domain-containing protein [Alphaproteobacteria bacterium]
MPITRISSAGLAKRKPKVDWKRLDATTEADIRRQAEEDGHPVWTAREFRKARLVMPPTDVDVREIRRRLRLSQRAFAAKFGFSPRTVQEWEQGRAQPDRPARLLLAMIARAPKTVERVLRRL